MPRTLRATLSLRLALVAALLLLAACGLTTSGIAVTSILRHSLIQRVDQTLKEASRGWAQAPRGSLPVRRGPTLDRPPSDFFVRYVTV
ncbi:MAG TPA: two-component sensor histidine kinase, partial [Mycobacterium sp.]